MAKKKKADNAQKKAAAAKIEQAKVEQIKEVKEIKEATVVEPAQATFKSEQKAEKLAKTDKFCFKTFIKTVFAKKYDKNENILNIFKKPSLYGGILAEMIGAGILASILLLVSPSQGSIILMIVMIGINLAFFGISGAQFNPAITAGMMASRRISAIRGVMYMLAQIIGAWFGFMIVKGFMSENMTADQLMHMAEFTKKIDVVLLVELIGSVIVGIFFARASVNKKQALTFSILAASGIITALLIGTILTSVAELKGIYSILNPAIAIIYQVLPKSGEFGELMQGLAVALGVYFVVPMVGSSLGFFLSDSMETLSKED